MKIHALLSTRRLASRTKENGATLVEFALSLPVVLIFFSLAMSFLQIFEVRTSLSRLASSSALVCARNTDIISGDVTPDACVSAMFQNSWPAQCTATGVTTSVVDVSSNDPYLRVQAQCTVNLSWRLGSSGWASPTLRSRGLAAIYRSPVP